MQLMDSHVAAGQDLPMKDRQAYYTALVEYLAYGIEPSLKGAAKAVFTAIKPTLDNSRERAKAGSKGGSKSPSKREANVEAKRKQTDKQNTESAGSYQDSPSPSYSPSSSYSHSQTLPEGVQGGMEPPTLEEVRKYFAANCLRGDPDLFWANYDAKGWLDGNGFAISKWTSQALKWSRMQVERDAKTPERDRAPTAPKQMTDAEMDAEIRRLKDFLGEGEAA